ncbi:putative N-acetyltransferase domain protein (plasmid) [Selenomonas ruminantium subsp. lactilytica TAM6421]|uniref:Putative N-acetyltransferase domain protein n=1 Tax=Selenomonas ruminantium subsp. lactilytica (strain NBRC 103574 / TAM6421) TaxID=927704 RepID=I0GV49_SELRL|nr:GNAT family N-acetyltransferase [Selenomonas ruminantium]BAL84636.1 putative N-acetyltransferase domain protein [Selenomonas ruminantium subsp. lactilytica TAM6421]
MSETIITQGLPTDAMAIRQEVFVDEQGFHDEFDDIDSIAHHLILYVDKQAAGCCRLFPSKRENTYVMGRLAVRKQFRGKAYGKLILQEAEKWLCQQNIRTLELSAQVRVKPFYETLGYIASGEEYLDEYCPHIHMEKDLIK